MDCINTVLGTIKSSEINYCLSHEHICCFSDYIFNVDYISKKIKMIESLCDAGYGDKILLSHDDMFFTGFSAEHKINTMPRFEYVYKNILPKLDEKTADAIMRKNPVAMLNC